MNILSTLLGLIAPSKNKVSYRYGIDLQTIETNGVTGQPHKIATVFTCCKVLSENLSRMPLSMFIENDNGISEMKRHRLAYLLKHRPNNYQNSQQFFSTIEYHRNYFGNAFARVLKNSDAFPEALEIIHPGLLKEYDFINGELTYIIINPNNNREEKVSAWDMLHFRGISEDGIIGLSPLVAIERQTNINERGTSTIDHFYKNNATSPMALETALPTSLSGPAAGALKDSKKQFEIENAGPTNAGKWINLPIGTSLKPIAMQFADAQLIETLKFTREDISAAYGLPLFMVDGSAEKLDVEQLTTLFKNNTMGPIVAMYMAEINGKLLTRQELENGFSAKFDVASLIGMDYQSMVNGIKEQVVNGLMTPNEGAKKLGNKPIPGEWGNLHYTQAQYIPLENRDKYDVLMKTDPTLKTVDKKENQNPESNIQNPV
jgi:HK97 family phage portal protein